MKKFGRRSSLAVFVLLLVTLLFVGTGCPKKVAQLTVKVEGPQEVQVTVANGQSKTKSGNSPIQFKELPTGEYNVTIESEGYKTVERSVSLQEDQVMNVEMEEIAAEAKTYKVTLNLTDGSGNKLEGEAAITGEEDLGIKAIEDGKLEFEAVPGEYKLEIEAEGYEKIEKTITVGEEDTTVDLALDSKELSLKLNIIDENKNPLNGAVSVSGKNQEHVKKGSKVEFEGLEAGEYQLKISKEGYNNVERQINLTQSKAITEVLSGGNVEQYIIDKNTDKNSITIKNLGADEEAIIAASYFNLSQPPRGFDEDDLEYKVRREENQLIKEYGTNFGFKQPNYEVGDKKEFKISDDVKEGTVEAVLKAKGEYLYVFVDENEGVSQAKIDALVTNFDNNIYPRLTPEPDESDKVVVLLTEFDRVDKSEPYVTGYFDGGDLYKGEGNEQVMLYLNSKMSENTILTAAAHQYHHLIYFMTKAKADRTMDDAWINQGLAHVASQLCGYIDFGKKGWSNKQANGWAYDEEFGYLPNTNTVNLQFHDGSLPFTGASGLFTAYLIEQYSSELMKEIMISSQDPVKVIENYTGQDFEKIYANWMTTNVADNISEVTSEVYKYSQFDLDMMPAFNEGRVEETGVSYFRIAGQGGNLSLPLPDDLDQKLIITVIRRPKGN